MKLSGILIGHTTDEDSHTGCTVFICPPGTVGGVDVRGSAPGSRETQLLSPYKTVTTINAILLTGGSAFGLAAADGVVRYFAERNLGHPTLIRPVPIVSAAVVNDMLMNKGKNLPGPDAGYRSCLAASEEIPAQGNVGAGTGTTVGKWNGLENIMKGGFGIAGIEEDELAVTAAAVTNCVGDVLNEDGTVLAGARTESGGWAAGDDTLRHLPDRESIDRGANTTLVVVATNARMDKVGTNRLAQRAQDGLAIAVRPAHTSFDGDTTFALATGAVDAPFDLVANMAVQVVTEAIRNSVRHAQTAAGVMGLSSI